MQIFMEHGGKRYMKRFIGDRKFYGMLLGIVVPIIIQNGITNFVSLLDNLMVGRIGTEEMSGVAIVNQLLFVFNLCIFGGISGAGIFTSQFYGNGDDEGVRNTFRFKLLIALAFTLIGLLIFLAAGEGLISLFLHEGSDSGDIGETLAYGSRYLMWMLLGLLPFAASQVYSGTLRETGETVAPMAAGLTAVFVNLVFNYLLIYGKFGFPKLGVAGAAMATVLSRYVECAVILIWSHTHAHRLTYLSGLYRTLRIPGALTRRIIVKGIPLIVNEVLWALGITVINQCYSTRGLAVVAGVNISSTISNLFNVVFIAMGSSVAIIVGQLLGAGKLEEARDTDRKLIFASVLSCLVFGSLMALAAPLFPRLYNTTQEVRELATFFIVVSAIMMPFNAFMHASYFTLRSGGKTGITFLFDAGFVWVVSIPLAMALSRLTSMPVRPLYVCCVTADLVKVVIGFVLVKRGSWIVKIVDTQP